MATPKTIRDVVISLVKNTLSPRNPVRLEVPSPKFLNTTQNDFRSPVSRKCLSFSEVHNSKNLFGKKEYVSFIDEASKTDEIEKESMVINTPTKSDLLKNGLTNRKKKLVDILGRGTFGTVVKGSYQNSLVAVKIIKYDKNTEKPADSNAKRLSHKNIVQVLDIIIKPNADYVLVIMEYKQGSENLQSIIEMASVLNKETKIHFLKQICSGLQYCHDNGVLHLDIKPKNILVLPTQQCKICDFGNSCEVKVRKDYVYQGTIAYAAPELLRGQEPTEKCDVYSLGITIWQLEYRRDPYENWTNSKSLLYHVVKNNVRPAYIPKNDVITQLFISCWAENPISRPGLEAILKQL